MRAPVAVSGGEEFCLPYSLWRVSFSPQGLDWCQSWILMGVKEGFSQERPGSPRVALFCWEWLQRGTGEGHWAGWCPGRLCRWLRNCKVSLNLSGDESGVSEESARGFWLQGGEWLWDWREWTQGDWLVGSLPPQKNCVYRRRGAAALRLKCTAEMALRGGSGQAEREAVRALPLGRPRDGRKQPMRKMCTGHSGHHAFPIFHSSTYSRF